MRLRIFTLAVLAVVVGAGLASSPEPALATHNCGSAGSPAGPYNLLAYEASDWRNAYGKSLEFAGFNQLFPELSTFALPRVETGPRSAGSGTTTTPYAPPSLLKAIAWIESGWQMASSSVSPGSVGSPLLSHSCAYGVMQIVTGMENTTNVPSLDQVHVGSHYGFNIARGARILVQKWNLAPEHRPLVGSRNPSLVEDWYYAIWSYHGFSYTNHPLNPIYSPSRGTYRCDGTQSFGSFPYQELVLGCLRNPPSPSGSRLFNPIAVSMPNLAHPAFGLSNWDACSGSFSCAGMDFPSPTPTHTDPTTASGSRSAAIGSPSMSIPSELTFSAQPGGQSSTISINIRNAGTGPMAWRFSPSVSWLRFSRTNGIALGSDIGSKPSTISVWADATGLPAGIYSGSILVSSLYPNATRSINVTLIIGDPSFIPGISN